MKVLMFGWEYPPHVFGGLATANYGISQGLYAQGDIETVLCLPRPFGDEDTSACRIVAMNCVPIAWRDVDYDYVKNRCGNVMSPEPAMQKRTLRVRLSTILAASTKYSGPFCMVIRPRKVTTLSFPVWSGRGMSSNSFFNG